jgi:hypothetical protein
MFVCGGESAVSYQVKEGYRSNGKHIENYANAI